MEPDPEKIRESHTCIYCNSSNRQRAIIVVLKILYPQYKNLNIYEPSPWGSASNKIKKECKYYTESHYFPGQTPGTFKKTFRCENLEKTTFNDSTFDLIITQDVFEHILRPHKAFLEIKRILKPGGAHIFTIPYDHDKKTIIRVSESKNGVKYNMQKVFHGNPIDIDGSLVITNWGIDVIEYIYLHSGMNTTIYALRDTEVGLSKAIYYVFVTKKPDL